VLPGARPQKRRRRTSEDADVRPHDESMLSSWTTWSTRRTLEWPGGGEPRFPMQLWDVGYGHVTTRHNPAESGMSLWTPGGDHPVGPPEGDPTPDLSADEQAQLAAMQAEMEEVRRQLLAAPAAVVVANHAMGIYELAAIHLTAETPKLPEAVLAIDALVALVEGLEGRLGDAEPTLREALVQLRAAFLEVKGRTATGGADASG
jgi:hypothetical protein